MATLVPNTNYLIQFIHQQSAIHIEQNLRYLSIGYFYPPVAWFRNALSGRYSFKAPISIKSKSGT